MDRVTWLRPGLISSWNYLIDATIRPRYVTRECWPRCIVSMLGPTEPYRERRPNLLPQEVGKRVLRLRGVSKSLTGVLCCLLLAVGFLMPGKKHTHSDGDRSHSHTHPHPHPHSHPHTHPHSHLQDEGQPQGVSEVATHLHIYFLGMEFTIPLATETTGVVATNPTWQEGLESGLDGMVASRFPLRMTSPPVVEIPSPKFDLGLAPSTEFVLSRGTRCWTSMARNLRDRDLDGPPTPPPRLCDLG